MKQLSNFFRLFILIALTFGNISVSANTIVIGVNTSTNQASSSISSTNSQNIITIVGASSNNQLVQNINNQKPIDLNMTNEIEADGFNAGNVITDSDIYGLSSKFDSPAKIKSYLKSTGSFLADYQVEINLEADDDLWAIPSTKENLGKLNGTKIDFSDFIWKMARTNLGNSCSLRNKSICLDQTKKPINPTVILSLIQRESGLVKGRNARLDQNNDTAKFLTERAVGYLCLEDDNKVNSCWDENPEWKYYKGMFRQVYYGMRLMLINSARCELGNYGSAFRKGNVVTIDDQNVKLENGFSCSIYIYTPHVLAQRNIYKVYREIIA